MKKYLAFVLVLAVFLNLLTPARIQASNVEYIESSDIYYSDDYFDADSTMYNPHLATLSMFMADRSIPLEKPDGPEWYEKQPKRLGEFFAQIGFEKFACNDDYYIRTRFDTIGVGAASRVIELASGTYTVIAVVPRSGGYYSEWGNNVWLGDGSKSDQMHEGWYNAANKLIHFLQKYVQDQQISGPVKLWMAGYSRGGATTNIAAALLDNQIDQGKAPLGDQVSLERDDLFAYTFEAPQGANVNSKTVKPPYDPLYDNIWNIVNPNDLVPKVAMSQFGFTRFGLERYITTNFYDPDNYYANRDTVRALWEVHNKDPFVADQFAMYGTPLSKVTIALALGLGTTSLGNGIMAYNAFADILTRDDTKSHYDANIATTLFLEELTSHIGSRKDYCNRIQSGVREFMLIFMKDEGWSSGSDFYLFVSGAVSALMLAGAGLAITHSSTFVEKALDAISLIVPVPEIRQSMKLLMPLLEAVAATYWEKPNEMISIIKYMENIFANHLTEVTLAHMQAQDSYYVDAYNQKHGTNLKRVPLRTNADFGRMSFTGFNDVELRTGGNQVVKINGHYLDKSDIGRCLGGYAAGYYSYATEEKLEIFFPAGKIYNISMDGCSKKPWRHVEYHAYYQYFRISSQGQVKRGLDSYSSTHSPFADRIHRTVNVR